MLVAFGVWWGYQKALARENAVRSGQARTLKSDATNPKSNDVPGTNNAPSSTAKSQVGIPKRIWNSLEMELVLIPPGTARFQPMHQKVTVAIIPPPLKNVVIEKSFYLGAHEVTMGQFRAFREQSNHSLAAAADTNHGYDPNTQEMTNNSDFGWDKLGFPTSDNHPVANICVCDMWAFCDWLSEKEGKKYRLPTSAEWHYSFLAGANTMFYWGNDSERWPLMGNVSDLSLRTMLPKHTISPGNDGFAFTAPVGSFPANGYGRYDMYGNVEEVMADWIRDGHVFSQGRPCFGSDSVAVSGGSFAQTAPDSEPMQRRTATLFLTSPFLTSPFLTSPDWGFRVLLEL